MFVRRMLLLIFGIGISCCIAVLFWTQICRAEVVGFEQKPTPTTGEGILPVDSLQPADVALPVQIKGTTMVAQKLACYDGAFLEDGSNEELVGVAALLVHNAGEAGILRAEIVLERDASCMVFCAELIPAGQSVLILEKDRKPYVPGNYTACSGWAVTEYGDWQKGNQIQIEAADASAFTVKNLTEKELSNIRLYYKSCYADGLFYLGGISYRTQIEKLMPGQMIRVAPKNYFAENSCILYVQMQES